MHIRLTSILIATITLGSQAADTAGITDSLRDRLAGAAASGQVYFGHHDDTAYGHTWNKEPGRSDVMEVTGSWPSMINWDLGMIEKQSPTSLDGVSFDRMRELAAENAARGGINSFSWHPRNPLSGGDSWDTSAQPLRQLDDPVLTDTMKAWIGRAADFIGSLRDDKGNPMPVIFRPWHEFTGSWFWWGKDFATPEQYKRLWELTRSVFDEHGVRNVLWAYSPDRTYSFEQYMERYPGDSLVDIFGVDCYQFNGKEGTDTYVQDASRGLAFALKAAAERGKLAAFTETGLEGVAVDNWYTSTLLPLLRTFPVSYVTVWRNAHDNPKHFYTPYPGHPACDDFRRFANDNKTIFLKK